MSSRQLSLEPASIRALQSDEANIQRWALVIVTDRRIGELELWAGGCTDLVKLPDAPRGALYDLDWTAKGVTFFFKQSKAEWNLHSGQLADKKPLSPREVRFPNLKLQPGQAQFRRHGDRMVVLIDGSNRVRRPLEIFREHRREYLALPASQRAALEARPLVGRLAAVGRIGLRYGGWVALVLAPVLGLLYLVMLTGRG